MLWPCVRHPNLNRSLYFQAQIAEGATYCLLRVLLTQSLAVFRCAIDQQPKTISSQQLAVLAHLAEMVVRRIERDKQILLQQHSRATLLRTLKNQQEAVPILFTNKSCHDMLGWDEETLGDRGVWDVFKMEAGSKVPLSLLAAMWPGFVNAHLPLGQCNVGLYMQCSLHNMRSGL